MRLVPLTAADILHQAQQLASTLQERQVLLGTLTIAGCADIIHTGLLHLLAAVDATLGLVAAAHSTAHTYMQL